MTEITKTAGVDKKMQPYSSLMKPIKLGEIPLKNSLVMAPMTRCLADDDLVPTDDMAAYYARRAEAGLIISEATIISPDGQGYPNTPGIYSDEQIAGWKKVTDKVHDNGGKMFLQLWHVGRVSHPIYLKGEKPVAPSAVLLEGTVPRQGKLKFEIPRALETHEIPMYAEKYAKAARNAIAAGFDGVEIHGANGYLIDQFLHYSTNKRSDEYGGSPEKMARFAIEVVEAVCASVKNSQVGIRLSPGGYLNGIEPLDDDAILFRYLLKKLEDRQLAYVHVGIFDDSTEFKNLNGSASGFLRKNYKGTVIGNGSYSIENAEAALENKDFDLVAIGRPFIANHDLVKKISSGEQIKEYEPSMLKKLY